MAKFDFRILLETIEGKKTSYISQSFVDTSQDLVLSASQVYNRITGSVSCSYQNAPFFTGDFNGASKFKDNLLLSASLSGSLNTGSIDFTATTSEYDRLLRYKFIGEKVCNVLGLPSSQWIYVDQVRLPVDDESNVFQGNIDGENIFVSDTLAFSGNSNINSDIPILINTGSDKHIKFIDERNFSSLGLIIGYDKSLDTYEISGSTGINFNIGGVDKLLFSDGTSQTTAGGGGSGTPGGSNTQVQFNDGGSFGGDAGFTYDKDNNSITTITHITASGHISASGATSTFKGILVDMDIIHHGDNDTKIRFSDDNIHLTAGGNVVQFETTGIDVEGDITASGNISASGGRHTFGGTTILGDTVNVGNAIQHDGDTDTKLNFTSDQLVFTIGNDQVMTLKPNAVQLTAPVTASGNVSSSGDFIGTTYKSSNLTGPDFLGQTIQIVGDNGTKAIGKTPDILLKGNVETTSHITASGNISASGDLYTDGINIGGNVALTDSGTELYLGNDNTWTNINYGRESTDTHTFNGSIGGYLTNITASGNISASGVVRAITLKTNTISQINNKIQLTNGSTTLANPQSLVNVVGDLFVNSHITASGNISASGLSHKFGGNSIFGGSISGMHTVGGNGTSLVLSKDASTVVTPGADIYVNGNLKVATHITASQNISASGTIYASKLEVNEITSSFVTSSTSILIQNITSSGDSLFGNDPTDTHTFTGDITASGNISASGQLITQTLSVKGGSVFNDDLGNNNFLVMANGGGGLFNVHNDNVAVGGLSIAQGSKFQVNGDMEVSTNITASGDISASGTITAEHIVSSDDMSVNDLITAQRIGTGVSGPSLIIDPGVNVTGHITASGNISASGTLDITGNVNFDGELDVDGMTRTDGIQNIGIFSTNGASVAIESDNIQIRPSGGGVLASPTSTVHINGDLKTSSHITASGNISSSGIVYAEGLQSSDDASITDLLYVGRIRGNGNTIDGHLSIQSPTFFGSHITASGDISASGTIKGGIYRSFGNILGTYHAGSDAIKLSNDGNKTELRGTNITISGPVTASGDISSSGGDITGDRLYLDRTIQANGGVTAGGFTSTGNTIFGNAATDTHTFTGHITASGNISASGTITASGLSIDDITIDSSKISDAGTLEIEAGANFHLDGGGEILLDSATSQISVLGNITASGNISGSSTSILTVGGDINTYEDINLNTNNKHIFQKNSGGALRKLIGSNASDELEIGSADNSKILLDNSIDVSNHITASGNISASSTSFFSGQDGFFTREIRVGGAGSQGANGSISTTGNISSSGTLIVNNITASAGNFSSHITASGNISASGVITAEGLVISDDIEVTDMVQAGRLGVTNDATFNGNIFGDNSTNISGIADITTLGDSSFGNTILDTHKFKGHITASNNISASGDIIVGGVLKLEGTSADLDLDSNVILFYDSTANLSVISKNNNTLKLGGGGNWTDIQIGREGTTNKNIEFFGPVTASGLKSSDSAGLTFTGNITASNNISASNYVFAKRVFLEDNEVLRYSSANSGLYVVGGIQTTGNSSIGNTDNDTHTFVGAITASGNISASGYISGSELHINRVGASSDEKLLTITEDGNERFFVDEDGDVGLDGTLTSAAIVNGGDLIIGSNNSSGIGLNNPGTAELSIHQADDEDTKYLEYKNSGLNVTGPVTASGDISSSIALKGKHLILSGGSDVFTSASLASAIAGGGGGGTTSELLTAGTGVDYGNGSGGQTFNGSIAKTINLDLTEVIASDGANRVLTSDGDGTLTAESAFTIIGSQITASGNISASGTITASGFNLVGSGTAELEVGGHITASGNISSSGDVYGDEFYVSNKQAIDYASAGDAIKFGNLTNKTTIRGAAAAGGVLVGTNEAQPVTIGGHLTASYSISSSGTIRANQFWVDSIPFIDYNDGYRFGFTNDTPIKFGKSNNPIHFIGQITASGNISASGNVISNQITASDAITSLTSITAGSDLICSRNIIFTHDNPAVTTTGAGLTFTGPITASGNISSSGTGDNYFGGNVTINKTGAGSNEKIFRINEDGDEKLSLDEDGDLTIAGTLSIPNSVISFGSQPEIYAGIHKALTLSSTGTTVHGQITASGNISASGEFIGKVGTFSYGTGVESSVGDFSGEVIYDGNYSTTAGQIYYSNNGTWTHTDADAASTATGLIAVALGSNSTNNGMLLRGTVKLDHDPGGDIGVPLYLSTTAGDATSTAPSGNQDIVRIIGYNLGTSGEIYFNPDNTWVEVSA